MKKSNSLLAFIPQNQSENEILKQTLFFQQSLKMRAFVLRILKKSSFFSLRSKEKAENIKNNSLEKISDFIKETIQKDLPDELIPRIQMGEVLTTLINESVKGGYDFMVLDKEENSLKKAEINKLISRSHCPVLLLNHAVSLKNIKKIVIPIDISQATQKRLLWATLFAKAFNAKIQIVSALNIKMDETKSLAFKNAEKIKTMLNKRGVECEIKTLNVHNQQKHIAILEYIEKEDPELVIIRTHQESIFADTRIGQFVSEIIHGCKMPVFTVGHSNLPVSEHD